MYKTDITILVDGSSSMSDAREKTLNAIREFVEEQKKVDGRCNLSVISFSKQSHWMTGEAPIRKTLVSGNIRDIEFTGSEYQANGWTPLYDAVCDTIDEVGAKFAKMNKSDRPDKVLFLILTDGQENVSIKKIQDVKNRIQHQENVYSWNFIYLGADFNSHEVRTSSGLDDSRSYNYDKKDTEKAWRGLNFATTQYRLSSNHKVDNFAQTLEANAK